MATLTNMMRQVCLTVQTIADGVAEPTETFTVFLNSPSPDSVVIGRSNSTGTILDGMSHSWSTPHDIVYAAQSSHM